MRKITKIEPAAPLIRPRKRVAAYARISMESERLVHSLSAQVSYYSKLIQSNPEWEYAGVYADSGISGTQVARREEFKRMLEDCEAGRIQIILTKSISRFARNTVDLLETVRHLKELGIEVRFEKEKINSLSEDGELMLTLLASFAQEESRSISENAKWAIRKRYEKGEPKNCILYGYRLVDGQFVIEHPEAEVVRTIFNSYLDGMSFYAIANLLNEKGTPSFRGKEWSTTVIGAVIRQEKYTGCCMLQKYYVEDCIDHKMRKNHGELPMFYVEDTHPAIISKETFDRAQREICTRYGVGMANGTAEKDNLAHRIEGKGYPRRKAYWSEESRRKHAEVYKSRETMKFLHHDFSLFIKCEACGQNLTGQFRTFADGTRELRWTCGKHNKVPHDTPDTRPRPPHMRDAILKRMVADVLGMETFDAQAMCQTLSHISALGDILTFHFLDGHEEKRRYIPGKRGYRRKESLKCREEG